PAQHRSAHQPSAEEARNRSEEPALRTHGSWRWLQVERSAVVTNALVDWFRSGSALVNPAHRPAAGLDPSVVALRNYRAHRPNRRVSQNPVRTPVSSIIRVFAATMRGAEASRGLIKTRSAFAMTFRCIAQRLPFALIVCLLSMSVALAQR